MIHFPKGVESAAISIRYKCACCNGWGWFYDRKGRGGRDYPQEFDQIECEACEGTGFAPNDDEEDGDA